MRCLRTGTKPLFGCLLETRVAADEFPSILSSTLPGWKAITNYEHHRLGRIWFCWTDGVEITLMYKSGQVITCAVHVSLTNTWFMFSAVYASNLESERVQLWDEIRATQAACSHFSIPWILMGDYNEILVSTEHSRSLDYRIGQSGMHHFQSLICDCNLSDIARSNFSTGGINDCKIQLERSWIEL